MRRLGAVLAAVLAAASASACSSGKGGADEATGPAAALSAFVETWSNPAGRAFRSAAGESGAPLVAALAGLRGQGVIDYSTGSLRSNGQAVTGGLRLHFDDGGVLETRTSATVQDGRVVVAPSLVSTELSSWVPLAVETFGSPRRGTLKSRQATPLVDAAGRAVRPDLAGAVAMMERAFSGRYAGRPGRVLSAGPGRRELARTAPTDGEDITTSLDDDLQAKAVSALGGRPGGFVVLDAGDGAIRAIASNAHPSTPDASPASDAHLPGSTFKIITAAAAARAGALRADQMIDCPADVVIDRHTIHNYQGEAAGRITVREAFARSCNTAFARIGSAVGYEAIAKTAGDFGIVAQPTAGAAPSRMTYPASQAEVATLAIGASTVAVSPVVMASVAATVAHGGLRVTPHWGDGAAPSVRVLDEDEARTIVGMMEEVVASGTGQAAAVPGESIAGKTGTAEVVGANGRPVGDDAWFVAFAPSPQPELVVSAYIPLGGTGGRVAAGIVRDFLLETRTVWTGADR